MLVIFSAFKKEAIDLIKLLEFKKTLKAKRAVIYDGIIKNKRVIICITGMGKSNSLFAAKQVIEMNLSNPVFIIQGVSGAVAQNIDICDLIFYESIKNLEQYQPERQSGENDSCIPDTRKQDLNKSKHTGEKKNNHVVYLPLGKILKKTGSDSHPLSDFKEIESALKLLNINFDLLKTKWEANMKSSRILKSSGGLVSYVVTDSMEKSVLNELYGIEAIDMESYFIADDAIGRQIPVICIRSISDNITEPISEIIIRFGSGNSCFKFKILINLIFSRSKIISIIDSYKNINIACRSLNQFVKKILLPYLGYEL